MDVVRIMGGLGNQLFQYAFGQSLIEHGNEVKYDTSWYSPPKSIFRPYCLDKFKINVPTGVRKKQYTEREVVVDLELLSHNDYNFYGYWQSPKYYSENLVNVLDDMFHVKEECYTPKFNELKKEVESVNSVSVHIRRGDYLNNDNHMVLPIVYYDNAIDLMCRMKENPEFYVFSDDIPWCRENFRNVKFVHLSEYLDFEIMRACKHHIIANSTFSWWPAFLNKEATIIAPATWTYDVSYWNEREILLSRWIKLSYHV